MRHSFLLYFFTVLLFISCSKQRPNGVLSEREIVDLFTEVSLIDAYLNTLPMDSGRKVMPVLYDNLFNQFKIDSNQFKQNLDYYYGNPVLTEEIYNKVNVRLMGYEQRYREEDSVRNVFVQDSIRYITNLQQIHRDRINQILYFTQDTTEYKIREHGVSFLGRLRIDLKAYGIQTAVIDNNRPIHTLSDSTLVDTIPGMLIDSLQLKVDTVSRLLPVITDSIIKQDIFHPIPWILPKRDNNKE